MYAIGAKLAGEVAELASSSFPETADTGGGAKDGMLPLV